MNAVPRQYIAVEPGMAAARGPSPVQNGMPTLDGLAGQAGESLVRCHAILDQIEQAVFGPEPPSAGTAVQSPGQPGLLTKLDVTAGLAHSVADRLQRVAERVGG